MQVCNYKGCHLKGIAQPIDVFATTSNGKPYVGKTCVDCLPRKRASCLNSIKDGGRVAYDRYQNGPKGKAKARRNDVSDKGRARHKRARESPVGRVTAKKCSDRRQVKQRNDPQHRVPFLLRAAYVSIINGRGAGARFFCETSFTSKHEFLDHVESTGVDLTKFGDEWTVEHRIPIAAYDHTDPAEVRKCWSKSNMTTSAPRANTEKHFKIVDAECLKVEPMLWPKQWLGVLPGPDLKEAMRVRIASGEGLF